MQRKWRRNRERGKTGLGYKKSGLSKQLEILAKSILPPVAAAGILLGSLTSGHANPTGGQIAGGTGTIAENSGAMTITQKTDKLAVNWQSFSIGSGETVQFVQPDSNSIALNRVLGNDASCIYGQLVANGKVFLSNPNGILFAPGASVNVGGIVASTLDISDSDFSKGSYKFTGGDGGCVVNQGTITVANGGYAALLAPQVRNEGVIVAQQGTVALGAGKAVTLNLDGDGLLNLAIDEAALHASAANHNLVQTDGGQVIIAARAAGDIIGTVVNNSGIIKARSLSNINGSIRLDGGAAGTVVNNGILDASGKNTGETGGTVKVLGQAVTLANGSKVDVSGDKGGGTALIGGNYQGQGLEQNAKTTGVAEKASIDANAITSGNGGKVVVWADGVTSFDGSVSATGGKAGGNGGQVETSGHTKLTVGDTARVYTSAINGTAGNWFLDHADFTIAASGGDMTGATLEANLANGNVTILSGDGTVNTNVAGNINVNDDVTYAGGNTLTLKAVNDINVNNAVTSTAGGNVVLRADSDADSSGTVNFGTNGQVVTDGAVTIYYNPVSYTDETTQSTTTNSWDWQNNTIIIKSTSNPYKGYVTGNLTAYMLVNTLADLENINTNLTGVYALGKDIDASATGGWNSGAGFTPIGGNSQFKGLFDGDGHVLSGLYINTSGSRTGLFGATRYATIRKVGLENVDITSNGLMVNSYNVGSLVGNNDHSIITDCYSTGTVTGNVNATLGGLVGYNYYSQISNSYTTVTVNGNNLGNGGSNVGGLVGYESNGFITNCYSTGAVTVTNPVNGASVGGLVGTNGGTISNSYSTGAVTLTNAATKVSKIGGLVGTNYSSIANSYTTSPVTMNGGNGQVGGFAGISGGSINNSYSTGLIVNNGSGNTVGGFIGSVPQWATGTITDSYWDTQTSGISDVTQGVGDKASAAGLTGLTTANLLDHTKYAGTWDFTNTWYMVDGHTRPFLRAEYSTIITNAHQLQLMAMDLSARYTLGGNIDMSGYAMAPLDGFFSLGNVGTPFTGAFDGHGCAVDGLTITSPAASAIGLFGYLKGATVSNVGLTNVNITGGTNSAYVGSLAGVNDCGSIANAYSTGTVSGKTTVGGLVGQNDGSIMNTYSTTDVSGTNAAGGLAGANTGRIATSYSTGTVTGTGAGSKAGGLVGNNTGSINNAYSASAVSANGGIAGGLVGQNDDGTVAASVWATDIAGQTATAGIGNDPSAAGVAGMTVANMKSGANHDNNWDFANTWFAIDGATLPFLRAEYSKTIKNAHQLQLMAMDLSADYVLGSNINLSGYKMGPDGFVILGSEATPFTGSLKGGNYTINGLKLSHPAASAVGLFGYTRGAAVSDLKLTKVQIGAGTGNLYVGSLVGYSGTGTKIANCTSSGTITDDGAGSAVGGLAGYNAGSIENSANTATVSSNGDNSNTGGLAGVNATGGRIAHSTNAGAVTANGTGSNVGGLVGMNSSTVVDSIKNAHNTGAVTSTGERNTVGGLAGENAGGITLASNEGAVAATGSTGKNEVGGLVGKNRNMLTNAYNSGTVMAMGANSSAGGLAGWNTTDGSVANAYSIGVVTGTDANTTVGGLIGKNDGHVAFVYSVGATKGSGPGSRVGGLAGANNGTFANAYWNTETTGQAGGVGAGYAAGAQGLITAEMMQSVNYTNWDADIWSLVDGVSLPYLNWQYSSTPRFISGVVQGGGTGKALDLVYWNTVMAQPVTIGANGFYYLVLPSSSPVSNYSRFLLYVKDDSNYKANSMYVCTDKGLADADLVKDTLIMDGGSTSLGNVDLGYIDRTRFNAGDNLLFTVGSNPGYGMPVTVNGNFIARSYSYWTGDSVIATGSINIQSAYDILMNEDRNKLGGYQDSDAQFIAGGDINITTEGNFIIRPGRTTSTQLSAGGNITIVTGKQFINYSGPDAFKLMGDGRWLVYTKDPVIYASDTALFYYARFPWVRDWAQRNRFVYSDEMMYAVTGGVNNDFVLWNSACGVSVPAAGNGFIYTAADPLSQPQTQTPRQVMRQEAMTAAKADPVLRPELPDLCAAGQGQSTDDKLPLLTVVDEGVKI